MEVIDKSSDGTHGRTGPGGFGKDDGDSKRLAAQMRARMTTQDDV